MLTSKTTPKVTRHDYIFKQKFKQYTEEKDKVLETIEKHSNASNGYLNLGISLYELSQKAKEIYLKARDKGLRDEQRNLIRLVFANMTIAEGKVKYDYSAAFKILAEAVTKTNSSKVTKTEDFDSKTFELNEKGNNKPQTGDLLSSRPTWLRLIEEERTYFLTETQPIHFYLPA